MPFKSRKQERYLQINEPEIYQDWVEEYGHFKGAESFGATTGKRMYCPACQTNRTWMAAYKKRDVDYTKGERPQDFLFYVCNTCEYAYDPKTSLEIKNWKIKYYGAESFGADFSLEDGQEIPNLTIDEWTEVSKALGKVGTFHNWRHESGDGEGGNGTTLVVNKRHGVFGRRNKYECDSCGYEYSSSMFPDGFNKHEPISFCEYCLDKEGGEDVYGAESFGAESDVGEVLSIVNPSGRSENDDPRKLYVSIGFRDGEIYRGYVELDSEYEMDEKGYQRKKAESFSAEFAAEASYCSNFNDHQWIPFGSEEMSCDKCDAIATPETIKLASEDMFAESFGAEWVYEDDGWHEDMTDAELKQMFDEQMDAMEQYQLVPCRTCGSKEIGPEHPSEGSLISCDHCGAEYNIWGELTMDAESFGAYRSSYKPKKLKRVRQNSAFPSGTSLQGYIKTNRTELRKAFGKPNMGASDDGKVKSSSWNLIIDGKVCTIYDRRERGKRGMKYFHIGGRDMFSPLLVAQELSKKRGEQVNAHETVPKWNEEKRFHERVNSIGEHPIITYDRAMRYYNNQSRYRAESFGADSSETFVFNVADVSGESDDVFTYFIKADNEVEAEEKLHYEVSQDYPDMKFDFMLDGSFGAESFGAESKERTFLITPILDWPDDIHTEDSLARMPFTITLDEEDTIRLAGSTDYRELSDLLFDYMVSYDEPGWFGAGNPEPRWDFQEVMPDGTLMDSHFGAEYNIWGELTMDAESFSSEMSHSDKSLILWEMVQQNLNYPPAVEGFYATFFGVDTEYYDGMDLVVLEAVKDLSKNPEWTDEMFKEYGLDNCYGCGDDSKTTKYLPFDEGEYDYWCKECYEDSEGEKWDAESFSAELKRDSCCCGATKSKPCACMIQGVMECSAVEPKCPCYAAKGAESFDLYPDNSDYLETLVKCRDCHTVIGTEDELANEEVEWYNLDGEIYCRTCKDSAESFRSYKVAPNLSSYTKAELVSSIAGPQGTAAYQEVVYDPIAQSRMSAETATQRFKDYGNSLAGDSVCPACGSEDWDESFEDDEWRGYCGCGNDFSVDSAAANPLLTFYELEALKEQGTLTSDQKEYLEWTITSTLRELDSSSYTKQHIQDELVAHGWTLNRWGNAEPPKESASTLVVNAESVSSFSPTRLIVLGASIGVALGLYKTRGD